jgi:DNA-binding MarR family transcriptional regulator
MLHVSLIVYDQRRDMTTDRAALLDELMTELPTPSPAQAMRYMRHWPGGRISLIHINVISVLETDGPQPMRALAEALDVSQASATGIVDRMEQRGLVERRRDEEDRRVVRVILTDEGRQLVEGVARERQDHMRAMLDEFTDDELQAFLTGTRAMRRARELLHERVHERLHDRHADPIPSPTPEARQ